jgi:hypothetical protein
MEDMEVYSWEYVQTCHVGRASLTQWIVVHQLDLGMLKDVLSPKIGDE